MLLLLAQLLVASAAPGAGVEPVELPAAYAVGAAGDAPSAPWWELEAPASLQRVIDEGLRGNLDAAAAAERVRQADALAQVALAPVLPRASFDASVSAAPLNTLGFQFGGLPGSGDTDGLFYNASAQFNARIELDVFGRNVVGFQAALSDKVASRADLSGVLQTLAGRIANAWFDVGLQRARGRVLREQIDANTALLELVTLRYDRGEATAVDLLQQRQQVAALQAQLPAIDAGARIASQQLAVLLGRTPSNAPTDLPDDVPTVGAPPALGSPEDLLTRRPDLRRASATVKAAWQRRMQRERAFLPTLSGSVNAGWQFFDAGELREQFAWGFGGAASLPIFDGGLSIGQLRQARAAERAAADTLGQTALTALQQVESAWLQDDAATLRLVAVEAQTEAARLAWEASAERYAQGVGDYLQALTTLAAWQSAQLTTLQARRDVLTARIALHEALGGPWTGDPEVLTSGVSR